MARHGGAHGIAVEITERIKARDLALPPIHYRDRVDKSSGKLRRLGIESAMQQCMNYVAVYALMPMLKAKVGRSNVQAYRSEAKFTVKRCLRNGSVKIPKAPNTMTKWMCGIALKA